MVVCKQFNHLALGNKPHPHPLTSPLGHQRVDVHEESQQLMRLTEARLIPVESDHDRTLERFVAELSFATSQERVVHLLVKDGEVDSPSFLNVHQSIVLDVLVRLFLQKNM